MCWFEGVRLMVMVMKLLNAAQQH
ncbi:hypothetical protein A2U01_0059718 [Trifolium medium]|uniref:Uncharacterized protein n=1 Tax=Trifolium medium TaxID=97028 RepID=A0A392RRT3_9FABA|nr:hypothetical protein [Trifolium medium]